MARVLPYERVVDAVFIHRNSALDSEIRIEMKIKEEPADTTSDFDATEDCTLIKNCFSLIDHDYHYHCNESSISKNDVLCKDINNKENKHLSNINPIHSNDMDKTVTLEPKSMETKKEIYTLSQTRKEHKYSNEISSNKNINTLPIVTTKNVRRKRKSIPLENCKTKLRRTVKSTKKGIYCDICFREFSSSRNREIHMQYYEFGDFTCRICKKKYRTRDKLISHICHSVQNMHTNLHAFFCNFCNRYFKSKEFLQSHLFHTHNELICSSNVIKQENYKSNDVNTSLQNDKMDTHDLKTDTHEEPCLKNLIKPDEINITFRNVTNKCLIDNVMDTEKSQIEKSFVNKMSPTKKLRQPTLTEYLELCKKKHDTKVDPKSKSNIIKNDLPDVSHHDEGIQKNSRPKLSEGHNESNDSLNIKSDFLPEKTACSTLEENVKYETSLTKKPFVKLHADVEMMKCFLEKLSNTDVKNKVTENQICNTVLYDREIPYSLRSLRVISPIQTNLKLEMKKAKTVSKKSQLNMEFNKKEQNITDSGTIDSKVDWKPIMTYFKCKDCTVLLTRCDEQQENSYQIEAMKNISPSVESNFISLQKSTTQNKMMLKDLEIPLERLTTVSTLDLEVNTKSDTKEHNKCFLCKVCKKSFPSKLAKRIHIKSSHTAYMSSICDARYTQKHKLLQHYLHEHLLKQNQCCICYILLPDYEALKEHLNVHCLKYIQRENDRYPVNIELKCKLNKITCECRHCNKIFSSLSSLVAHQSCCTVQKEMKNEDQKDCMENTSPKNILKMQQNKNIDENTSTCDERTHSDNLCESSNSNSMKESNQCEISLVNEKEPEVNQDNSDNSSNDNSSINNNLLIQKEIETVNKLQDSEKFTENNNSTNNNQETDATLNNSTTKSITYPCDICGKQFYNQKKLELHVRSFSFNKDICPMCNTGFSSKRLLQTHISAAHVLQISKTYSFHCVFCNQGFFKKHDLRSHILHLHGAQMLNALTHNFNMSQQKSNELVIQGATCNICNLVFETQDRFIEHRMYYYKNHTFSCSFCAQNFQGMYMFHHHNKLVHYSEDKRKSYNYICDICNEGFNHESHFHSHNMHVHAKEENLSETAKGFKEKSDLNNVSNVQEQIRNSTKDQEKQQTIEQPFNECICQICQIKCKDMNDMTKHMEFYSNDGDFKCDKCNKQYKTSDLLDEHMKLSHFCHDVHDGHICHICGEIFLDIVTLKCHEKHLHSNISNNLNNWKNCNQALSSNTTIKTSTNKAIEELCESEINVDNAAKYNCLFCNMKFPTTNAVQTHIVYAHIDDMIAKRATLGFTLPIIDSNDVQKQFVKTNQTTISSLLSSSFENNLTHLNVQKSNNVLNDTISKNGKDDNTTTEVLKKFKIVDPKTNKVIEATSIPPLFPLSRINKSKDNILASKIVVPSTETKADTPVSLSTESSSIAISNVGLKINNPISLSAGSTNNFRKNCEIPLKSGSINEFKTNLISSQRRSIIIDRSKMMPVCLSATKPFKNIAPLWKDNETGNQKSGSINNYGHGYSCPLCTLEYPSLMFFHAHLKYSHADSIRSDEPMSLQMNQIQKNSMIIECLLCPCTFITETKYKQHLRNSHTYYVYMPHSEERTKNSNASNSVITQTNTDRNTIPETITIDDDDDNDNVKNSSCQQVETTPTLDHGIQNEKIGKLRVKPFAKIIENLSTYTAL
ncbi:uncharacterized protein LOC105426074 [Pogonomyrmex barbatus]|uniref:Uncharacterized protein LOC105426074 n=1 Tax=Pogonomyrmex barbatus TaxID=144034 RepID=A0A6I9W1E2_9HYME|nr:uncharacterized protein LOC105426074 [Pogonomyrmex barbatus]XP_011635444.1 uncharacterized protein LOC105426074 [Pogonomyrmex barbatus]